MPSEPSSPRLVWLWSGLTLFTLFFLLGARSRNEPDEGHYAEIAREMVETGDWLVPKIWYVPHLDEPPLTYWAVATSLKLFGTNEWAVRLPVALAGLSGVWAGWLLGLSLGGRRPASWSVLILLSSVICFVLSRLRTTDIFLTQFIAWALYCFWRCWRSLDGLSDADENQRARAAQKSFIWQVLGWSALAGGFLTKGPLALAIPTVAFGAILVYRRRETARFMVLPFGAMAGVTVFSVLAVPWYWLVFDALPEALDFTVSNPLANVIKNRGGSPFYFFGVLALGFLPWTPLLWGLWRRIPGRNLNATPREGWVLLSAWVIFTFVLCPRNHQTLKPIGVALRNEFRPRDQVLVWGRLPQGLPFYAYPAISATQRPYLGGLRLNRMPFEFPGNQDRLKPWLLGDPAEFRQLLARPDRVLVVAPRGSFASARAWHVAPALRLIAEAGDWELFSNR